MTGDPLLRFRPEFPLLEKTTDLISNSLGAMPRGAEEGLSEYARTWATRGVRAWAEGWWEMSIAVGDEIAPLFGAHSGTVTRLPNVTIASAVVLSSLDLTPPRNRIVLVEGEFPTVRYLYETLGPRLGGAVSVDFNHVLEVSRELNARDVVVDYRPGAGIRLSPHFYTSDEELDRAFDVIDEIRASRAWERWSDQPTVVT